MSQPSSCQRTRSASVAGDSAPSCRQQRASRSPCSVSASITTRVHARPRSSSRSSSRSARPLAANAATSTRVRGRIELDLLDQIGRRRDEHGRPGVPAAARSWNTRPSTPKRASTASGGSAATSPSVRNPRRTSSDGELLVLEHRDRPRREERGRRAGLDHPRRRRLRARRAARPAVNSPSAIPMRTSASPSSASTMTAWSRSASSEVAAEVARRTTRGEAAAAGAIEHDTRGDGLDRTRDELERAGFEREVGVDHLDVRAPGFGFAAAHAARDTVLARASADAARTRSRLPTRSRTTTGTPRAATGRAGAPRPPASRGTRHSTCGWSAVRSSPSPRARRAAPRRCAFRFHAHMEIAGVEPAAPGVDTAPLATFGVHPHRRFDRPRTDRDEHGRALRARATSRRASPTRNRGGTVAATSATPSSNAATTVLQRSAGQRRITAHRSSSTPAACAARAPSVP